MRSMTLAQHTVCMPYAHGRRRDRGPKGRKEGKVARFVETYALGSVGQMSEKNYLETWNTWVKERKARGKEPWLNALADPIDVLNDQLECMASRCFVHNDQQFTVRGYLDAINFVHKMSARYELPTSHCIILAMGKGIDRVRGMSNKKARV